MSYKYDEFNRLYTDSKHIADTFKIRTADTKKEEKAEREIRIPLTTYDKSKKVRYLPPSQYDSRHHKTSVYIDTTQANISLYDRQEDLVDNVSRHLVDHSSAFVYSDMGTGKSYIIMGLIQKLKQKTLIIVPSDSIRQQLVDKLRRHWLDNVQLADWYEVKQERIEADILVTVKTPTFTKIASKINWHFPLVIVDEAHNWSPSLRDAINKRTNRYAIIWLTWTPRSRDFTEEVMQQYWWPLIRSTAESLPVEVVAVEYKNEYDIK